MRKKQMNGDVSYVTANKSASLNLDPPIQAKHLQIREDEADGYVHVFVREKHVDINSKSINNIDKVIAMHKNEFDRKVNEGYFQLYDQVEIIHDPRDESKDYTDSDLRPGKSRIDPGPLRPERKLGADLQKKATDLAKKEADLKSREADLAKREAALNTK